ncbi:MAG: potassium channel family protein [Myxococcota bacterium]
MSSGMRSLGRPIRRVVTGLVFFGATCAAGVVGYRVAGWSAMDALYMVIITIFGVGYGEVQPVASVELRSFTIGIIVAGYGAAIYAVGGFVQLVTEGEINRALGARRMTRQIGRLRDHTVVCGYGRVGRILVQSLAAASAELVVVDRDRDKILAAESAGHRVVLGDAAGEDVLREAGVEHASQLAAVLPSDAANVFVTLTATGMNHHLVVTARAEDPASESKLRRSGAEHVILPAAIGAHRIANLITRPSAEDFLSSREGLRGDLQEELAQLGLQVEELSLPPSSPLVGRPLDAIEIGGNHGFLIVGLRRAGGRVLVNPDDGETLREGDTVIVLGHANDLPALRKRYELERPIYYRGARLR